MANHGTMKGIMIALLTLIAYSSFILDIIQIIKVHENENHKTYPPAVVAMLVAACLQMLWGIYYITRSGRGVVFKASNAAAGVTALMLFQLGAVIAATVLRHHDRYCSPLASNYGDCQGVMRGTMGLGYATVGMSLIFLGYLAILVSRHGSWSADMYDMPPRVVRQDVEAPKH